MSRQTEPDALNDTAPSRTSGPCHATAPARPAPRRPTAFNPADLNPPAPPQPQPAKESDAGFGSFG